MAKCLKKYQWILDEYPEYITKEQLYQICQVSKKTALHYLANGLIPCRDTGKKTRRYSIKTEDVVLFLQARDENPESYSAPHGWYKGQHHCFPKVLTPAMREKLRAALTVVLETYPDVLDCGEVCKITSYCKSTINKWCSLNQIKHFNVRGANRIPKAVLLEYLTQEGCHAVNEKAYGHILMLAKTMAESDCQPE